MNQKKAEDTILKYEKAESWPKELRDRDNA